ANDFLHGKNTESLVFSPVVALYQGTTRITTDPAVLSPGTQYTVVIGMFNMHVPAYPTRLANDMYPPLYDANNDYGTFGDGYVAMSGTHATYYDWGVPMQIGDTNGFIGLHGLLYSYSSNAYTYYWGALGSAGASAPDGTGRVHLVRYGSNNFHM